MYMAEKIDVLAAERVVPDDSRTVLVDDRIIFCSK